jgi:hypothetical protein
MSLEGKTIVFSGVLSITRKDASDLARNAGAVVANVVNNQTNILVASMANADSKLSKAQELGIVVWDEDAFMEAISIQCSQTLQSQKPTGDDSLIQHIVDCLTQCQNNGCEVPFHYFEKKSQHTKELKTFQKSLLSLVEKRKVMLADERRQRNLIALEKLSSKQPHRKSNESRRDTRALKAEVQNRLKNEDRFYRACVGGRLVLVRAFLQNGGDVNVELEREDGSISYGLMEAVRNGHLEVVAKILSSKADTSLTVGDDKESVMHLAVGGRDPRMVQLLLRVSCDAQVRTTKTGRTPLISLAAHCVCGVVATNGGGGGGGGDNNGGSTGGSERGESEHMKLAQAQARMAELLLSEGKAEVGVCDGKGRTAYCYARERRNEPLADMLNKWRNQEVSNVVCRYCKQSCGSTVNK